MRVFSSNERRFLDDSEKAAKLPVCIRAESIFSNLEFCVPTQKKHAYPARLAKWRKETLTFFSKAKFAQMILLPPESRFSHNLRFVIRSQNHFSIKLRISLKQPFFKWDFHHLGMIEFQKFQRGSDCKGPKYILSP